MTGIKRIGVFLIILLIIIVIAFSFYSVMRVKPAMSDLTTLPTIVIDPGHGGIDGGAVSNNGKILEKDINLSICLILQDIFILNGFDVCMTRDTDVSIHDEGISSVRKQKTSDLQNRLKIANENPNTIFISVHQNKFSDKRSKGTQVFYSPNNPGSERYADILQNNFLSTLQHDNTRRQKKAGKNLFLMYKAACPAVLIECGFLSNPDEAVMLIDEEYQSKISFAIFSSTMKFLGLDESSYNSELSV